MSELPDQSGLEVWMDGDCPICERSRCWIERRDPDAKIRFRDFRGEADAELPVVRSRLEQQMWVRLDDGSLAAGFAGWRRIMRSLPGWRWLAVLAGIPPVSWLGALVYRLVARYRFALARRRPQ